MNPCRLAALALAGALGGGLLGGCLGGTTSEGGNPELVVGFRKDGRPVAFKGYGQVFAHGANPEFHLPPPMDGSDEGAGAGPDVHVGNAYSTNLFIPAESEKPQAIDGNFLARAAGYRVSIPSLPRDAKDRDFHFQLRSVPGEDTLDPSRPFNLVFRSHDGSAAFVQGIAIDSARQRYRGPDGQLLDVLWVDLHPTRSFSGVVDTNGLSRAPLALFSPGSPYVASMRGNRFLLEKLPMALLPVRLVTESGALVAFAEMLDATMPGTGALVDTLPTLVAGPSLGSVAVPAPHPMLAPPAASPAGPYKFTDSLLVTLDAEPGSTIYYTLDANPPGLDSRRYTGPLVVRASCILKAVAYRKGVNHSLVSLNSYTLVPPAPVASPPSRAFRDSLAVALSTDAKNATILYTTDGSAPTAASPIYSGPIRLDRTTVLKAATSVPGLELSPILDERYILVPDTLQAP